MHDFVVNKLFPILSRLGYLIVVLARSTVDKARSIDYTNRRLYFYLGGAGLLLIGAVVTYRLLNPLVVLEKGDYGPFESKAEYDAFVEQHPLLTKDEPPGRKFNISSVIREDKRVVYTIVLQSRPIKPEMNDVYIQSYLAVLEESQKDALDWIRSQGQNPDDLGIIWRPNPLDRRRRLLGETTKSVPQKNAVPATNPSPTPQPTSSPTTPTTPTPTPSDDAVAPPPGRFPL